ncbi:MAG: hypothetical protein SGARI_003678 [Bacillariaceae sp.]
MGTAWLVLAPIAIGASLVRRLLPEQSCCNRNGTWFRIHFYCQVAVVALTIAGFLVVWLGDNDSDRRRILKDEFEAEQELSASSLEDTSTSTSLDEDTTMMFPALGWTYGKVEESTHPRLGVIIVALAVIQAFLGFIRPHLPPAAATTKKVDSVEMAAEDPSLAPLEDDFNDESGGSNVAAAAAAAGGGGGGLSLDSASPKNSKDSVKPQGKSAIRVIWEWCHRCLGLCLLAISWLQCTMGIKLYQF